MQRRRTTDDYNYTTASTVADINADIAKLMIRRRKAEIGAENVLRLNIDPGLGATIGDRPRRKVAEKNQLVKATTKGAAAINTIRKIDAQIEKLETLKEKLLAPLQPPPAPVEEETGPILVRFPNPYRVEDDVDDIEDDEPITVNFTDLFNEQKKKEELRRIRKEEKKRKKKKEKKEARRKQKEAEQQKALREAQEQLRRIEQEADLDDDEDDYDGNDFLVEVDESASRRKRMRENNNNNNNNREDHISNYFITVNTHVPGHDYTEEEIQMIAEVLQTELNNALYSNTSKYLKVAPGTRPEDIKSIKVFTKPELQQNNNANQLHTHTVLTISHSSKVQLDYAYINKMVNSDIAEKVQDEVYWINERRNEVREEERERRWREGLIEQEKENERQRILRRQQLIAMGVPEAQLDRDEQEYEEREARRVEKSRRREEERRRERKEEKRRRREEEQQNPNSSGSIGAFQTHIQRSKGNSTESEFIYIEKDTGLEWTPSHVGEYFDDLELKDKSGVPVLKEAFNRFKRRKISGPGDRRKKENRGQGNKEKVGARGELLG